MTYALCSLQKLKIFDCTHYVYQAAKLYLMMSDHKHKSGAQKRKEKKKQFLRKRRQHIILIHFLLRKLHPLSKLKLQLTLAYKTKRQQSQRHLLNLKLLLILMNSLVSPSQMRVNSMGHQQRFQGLIL